jgi:hypothetical protein
MMSLMPVEEVSECASRHIGNLPHHYVSTACQPVDEIAGAGTPSASIHLFGFGVL